jgi:flagellar hook-associated protein 3 FlgL
VRISNNFITGRLLQQVQEGRRKLFEVQERTGSGMRINRPADDPTGAGRAMNIRTGIELADQYARGVDVANADLAVAESSVTALSDLLHRARELAVQAANGAIGAAERQHIALEISQLVSQAIATGNTRYAGRYIFAGHKTNTQPFVPDVPANPTTVAYNGDTGLIQREISRGELVPTNITGDRVFPQVFTTLIAFRDHLQTNNVTLLAADGDQLAARLESTLELRSELGAKSRRVEVAQGRLGQEDTVLRNLLSAEEDADLADSIVQLQVREAQLQASLGATGRALNLSLLEFLR